MCGILECYLNTKVNIWERKQHVEHFVRLLDKRDRISRENKKRTTEIVSHPTDLSLRVDTRAARKLSIFNELRPPTPSDLVRPVREFKDAPGVRTNLFKKKTETHYRDNSENISWCGTCMVRTQSQLPI